MKDVPFCEFLSLQHNLKLISFNFLCLSWFFTGDISSFRITITNACCVLWRIVFRIKITISCYVLCRSHTLNVYGLNFTTFLLTVLFSLRCCLWNACINLLFGSVLSSPYKNSNWLRMQQICVWLPASANNVTLLAFAAERRAAAPLSIDISCPPSQQQQTRRTLLQRSNGSDKLQ